MKENLFKLGGYRRFMAGFENRPECMYAQREEVIWNKLKRWGDENDKRLRIEYGNYNFDKGRFFYTGDILEEIKVNSKGIERILIPGYTIRDIPEDQLKSIVSYLSLVGRKGE